MKTQRKGRIVWHIHQDTGDCFLSLEKCGGSSYPGDSYITYITGPNASDLVCGDESTENDMRQYAVNNGITLTTPTVGKRYL